MLLKSLKNSEVSMENNSKDKVESFTFQVGIAVSYKKIFLRSSDVSAWLYY